MHMMAIQQRQVDRCPAIPRALYLPTLDELVDPPIGKKVADDVIERYRALLRHWPVNGRTLKRLRALYTKLREQPTCAHLEPVQAELERLESHDKKLQAAYEKAIEKRKEKIEAELNKLFVAAHVGKGNQTTSGSPYHLSRPHGKFSALCQKPRLARIKHWSASVEWLSVVTHRSWTFHVCDDCLEVAERECSQARKRLLAEIPEPSKPFGVNNDCTC